MKRLTLLASAAVAASIASAAHAAERTKFDFWYGLTGDLGEVVQKQCQLFNESQDKYEAVCTGQGGYDKAEQNTIAAYRAKQQPTTCAETPSPKGGRGQRKPARGQSSRPVASPCPLVPAKPPLTPILFARG